jgi:hypothetical protein
MKAAARLLATAITLAALSMLGLTAAAAASVPPPDEHSQHLTATHKDPTVPNSGHSAQYDRDATAPSAASQPGADPAAAAPAGHGRQLVPVLAVTLLGLLLALAGATWLRLRHRPREAI